MSLYPVAASNPYQSFNNNFDLIDADIDEQAGALQQEVEAQQVSSETDSESMEADTEDQPPQPPQPPQPLFPNISPEKAPLQAIFNLKHDPNEPIGMQAKRRLFFNNAPTKYEQLARRDQALAKQEADKKKRALSIDPRVATWFEAREYDYLQRGEAYKNQRRDVKDSLAEVENSLADIQEKEEDKKDERTEKASIPFAGTYFSQFGKLNIFNKV